ncbi:Uroporphyrinogen decarboxylase (URO-D) [Desulfatibacillum alkenivorans DSM 16219]|uniref:Uroporphyrinogen decarboxylase (URO-D) n=1 Tax=Desulfatibacillum alkenivorans DSM 16219 TaxID=1121393 RepID=A0A1M6L1T3_9BACT|nr:uroporphyrinogen decarboxylase family protein [Desulfatibacillum alkenivorans]SHJ65167.1 Uroporphyrinogen decarboxylase (URO-D) [Desulfatibacillum alkenivorans DSM 16219]
MKTMTGLERMLTTLKHQEPDRVPHGELHNPAVWQAIAPEGGTYEDFIELLDIDCVVGYDKLTGWNWELQDPEKGIVRDIWGGLQRLTSNQPSPMSPALAGPQDLEAYTPPDPDRPERYLWLQAWVKRWKGERACIAHATDVFDIARESLIGDVPYFTAMIQDPDYIQQVQEIILDYNLRYLKNCIEVGADALFITGDFATTTAPMVSPAMTRQFLLPPLKAAVELGHAHGLPVLKHSDGNIMPIIDDMLATGIDGLHPIDPMAGLDLEEIKKKYGDQVTLCGNVSCAYTLCEAPQDEVVREVKDCIRKAGKGGGYVCMSSNSIHSGVKPENYVAMVKAIHEFGVYPLDLD